MVRHTVLSCLLAATLAAQAPVFSLVGAPQVNPGQEQIDLYFKATGSPEGMLDVKDVTQGSTVKFTQAVGKKPESLGGSGKTVYWRTTWRIAGLLPGAQDSRALILTAGNVAEMLLVQLAARSAADLQVSVSGPAAPLQLRHGRDAGFRVTAKSVLTGVAISQAVLTEEKTGQPLMAIQMALVRDDKESSGDGLSLSKPVEPLTLRIKPDFTAPGKFTGTVYLSSNEKPDLGSFSLTVQSTDNGYKALGIACLAGGLALFCFITIWAKARARKIQALLPASRLAEEAQRLIRELNAARQTTGFTFPVLLNPNPTAAGSLQRFPNQLNKTYLSSQNYLPPEFASPFSSQDLPGPYQAFLLTTGGQLGNAGVLIRWGIATVVAKWGQIVAAGAVAQTAGQTALQTLDNLGAYAGLPDQFRNQIQQALNNLQTALTSHGMGGAIAGAGAGVPGITASSELLLQLEELSAWVWVTWGALTIVLGASALVLFNPSFGVPQDFLQCFLWGAGIPAVAQGLGGLSQNAVTTAFSMQIPR